MAENEPEGTPGTDPKVDPKVEPKVEPKVNVGPDGEALKPGDEGYLYAGKYKSVEEFEKGYSEADKKITELGQARAEQSKTVLELIARAEETQKVDGATEKEEAEVVRKERAVGLKKAWEKSPEDALDFMEKLIDDKQTGAGLMKRVDYDKKILTDESDAKEYHRVRGTGDPDKKEQQKEFDTLKPEMNKIWGQMPKEAKKSSMIETVFLAAKAKSMPILREKILSDIKAGTSQPGGGPTPKDERTEDDKIIDGIVSQAEKDRGKITD